ncbi:MAG: hypothetical protein PF588_04075 [Candidatus Kapabacteria bacterium]|jgi:hypothetical protein|nr:hypothetical protein [Candidatus Kapabacteria bacterium]
MKMVWFILLLLIGLLIFGACNKTALEKKRVGVSASEFMAKLDELGYFKYTDDKNLDRVKQSVVEGYCPEC